MITRKDGSTDTLHVSFSWSAFADNRSLSDVPVPIETEPAPGRGKGTLLAISGLRNPDIWEGSAAEQLITDLSQMISPFPEARPFLVTLKVNGRPIELGQVSERARKAAIGRFFFNFRDGALSLRGDIRLAKLIGNDPDFSDREISGQRRPGVFRLSAQKAGGGAFALLREQDLFPRLRLQHRLSIAWRRRHGPVSNGRGKAHSGRSGPLSRGD